ncbi:MAG: Ribosome maturation factor RimM [Pseudomonadota bacterium]|jgi:16S rRNA processing protein RimM
MTTTPNRVLLGHIASAHGIKGEVLIKSYAAVPEDIAAYGPLSDEEGARTFSIVSLRPSNKGLIARIEGVGDRNAAEALKGTGLYVDRDVLPEPEDDGEFYVTDLVGLDAVDTAGNRFGEIVAVQNFGAGDLLEIRLTRRKQTEFVSFEERFVPEVDVAARRVVVDLPSDEPDDDGPEDNQP